MEHDYEKIEYSKDGKEYQIVLNYDIYEVEAGFKKRRPGVIPIHISRFVEEVGMGFTTLSAISKQFKDAKNFDWKDEVIIEFERSLKRELKILQTK